MFNHIHLCCLVSGLYFIANYIEENPEIARKYLRSWMYALWITHALLLLVDRISPQQCLISALSLALHFSLLKSFPMVTKQKALSGLSAGM